MTLLLSISVSIFLNFNKPAKFIKAFIAYKMNTFLVLADATTSDTFFIYGNRYIFSLSMFNRFIVIGILFIIVRIQFRIKQFFQSYIY